MPTEDWIMKNTSAGDVGSELVSLTLCRVYVMEE